VEALHNRGLALQELGQLELARDAFTRALAIDPDDPETLAGAADLYINRLPPSAELSEIGVEYAVRGSQRLRRGSGPGAPRGADKGKDRGEQALLGRLLLLAAQGLNDLGRPREALQRLDAAIAASDSTQARYERAMALLDLCRFGEARRAFGEVLEREPEDAWAHYSLGLTLEMLGQQPAADRELARARQLAPREFPELSVSPQQFQALVDKEVQGLTPLQRADLSRVSLQTADLPELSDLTAEDPPLSPTILGLFRGLPLAEPSAGAEPGTSGAASDHEPRAIVLYRKNLLRAVRGPDELVEQIRTTLLHELGHLRGEDDAELRARGLE
jgi:tetratricopeptide (TPR) repeat protein